MQEQLIEELREAIALLEGQRAETQATNHTRITQLEAALSAQENEAIESEVMQSLLAQNKVFEMALRDKTIQVGELDDRLALLAAAHERVKDNAVEEALRSARSATVETEARVKVLEAELRQGSIKEKMANRALGEQRALADQLSGTATGSSLEASLVETQSLLSGSEAKVRELQWQLRMREEETAVLRQELVEVAKQRAASKESEERLRAKISADLLE